jgi:hypothetical protein
MIHTGLAAYKSTIVPTRLELMRIPEIGRRCHLHLGFLLAEDHTYERDSRVGVPS